MGISTAASAAGEVVELSIRAAFCSLAQRWEEGSNIARRGGNDDEEPSADADVTSMLMSKTMKTT